MGAISLLNTLLVILKGWSTVLQENWRERSLDYQIGHSEGYQKGIEYGAANARNSVFAYEFNSALKRKVLRVRWKLEEFYYRVLRPDDIPF